MTDHEAVRDFHAEIAAALEDEQLARQHSDLRLEYSTESNGVNGLRYDETVRHSRGEIDERVVICRSVSFAVHANGIKNRVQLRTPDYTEPQDHLIRNVHFGFGRSGLVWVEGNVVSSNIEGEQLQTALDIVRHPHRSSLARLAVATFSEEEQETFDDWQERFAKEERRVTAELSQAFKRSGRRLQPMERYRRR